MVFLQRVEKICDLHQVQVKYAFQDIREVPSIVPEGRTKPWGTGHAVLAAKDLIHESFAVINADDYYGREAFRRMHDWLILDHADYAVAMAGFILKNTLSENGGVTRGVCKAKGNHTHITDVIEVHDIVKTENGIESEVGLLDPESHVSMNFWGFPAQDGADPYFLRILVTIQGLPF